MAIIPVDLSKLTATFSVSEFCQAFGLDPPGGETYRLIKAAVRECITAEITIETPQGWEMFTWLSYARYDEVKHTLLIEYSARLATYLTELKKMYARIQLIDLGKLQSLYAIRFYEMAKSYESLAGKQGNRENCWFFERTLEELKKILGVEAENYKKPKLINR